MRYDSVKSDNSTSDITTNKSSLQRVKDTIKTKAGRALHPKQSGDKAAERSSYEAAVEELNESPAFNTSKLLHRSPKAPRGVPDKAFGFIQGLTRTILDPKGSIKFRVTQKAAHKLAKSHPYLSRQADLQYLEAYDDFERARKETLDTYDKDKVDNSAHQLHALEERRRNARVAWVTARHVHRVRVVHALPPPPFPKDSFFVKEDDCGSPTFDWGKWLAYNLLYLSHQFTAQYIDDFEKLPFDIDTFRRHVERLIIVSAPLQTFLSDVRCIYRWEDPARTAKWMALYFCMWYISHVMTFFYGYIIYVVVKNYFYPTSIPGLRAAIERSIDRGATAAKVGELMDRHGSKDWLGPLMEHLGPYIQVQIADFTNMLEAIHNFYHFASPSATFASLCLFGAFFLLSALGDSKFAMKVVWFIVGTSFFVCWPISSRDPRYRLLVSPFKWVLWDVPTHAEWSFQYLQERSNAVRETIVSGPPIDDHAQTGEESADLGDDSDADSFHSASSVLIDDERDILSFGCTYHKVPGRFIISTTSVRFAPSVPLSHTSFHEPLESLLEMSKRQTASSLISPLTTGLDKLELWFEGEGDSAGMHTMGEKGDARKVLLENMKERDKAFNSIIGFSGLRWQHLQI